MTTVYMSRTLLLLYSPWNHCQRLYALTAVAQVYPAEVTLRSVELNPADCTHVQTSLSRSSDKVSIIVRMTSNGANKWIWRVSWEEEEIILWKFCSFFIESIHLLCLFVSFKKYTYNEESAYPLPDIISNSFLWVFWVFFDEV